MHSWIELTVFILFAVPIAVVDIREYRIPDRLTVSGTAVFVALKLLWREESCLQLATEIGVGFSVFWLLWKLTRGQIGLGDAKLSAFIAVTAGLPGWFAALFAASLLGLLGAGLLVCVFKADRKMPIPFAPFLTTGALMAILFKGFSGLAPFLQL